MRSGKLSLFTTPNPSATLLVNRNMVPGCCTLNGNTGGGSGRQAVRGRGRLPATQQRQWQQKQQQQQPVMVRALHLLSSSTRAIHN